MMKMAAKVGKLTMMILGSTEGSKLHRVVPAIGHKSGMTTTSLLDTLESSTVSIGNQHLSPSTFASIQNTPTVNLDIFSMAPVKHHPITL
jgi:hypothetical protein